MKSLKHKGDAAKRVLRKHSERENINCPHCQRPHKNRLTFKIHVKECNRKMDNILEDLDFESDLSLNHNLCSICSKHLFNSSESDITSEKYI